MSNYIHPDFRRAICPDGKVRAVKRIYEPDTYFSVPAAVEVRKNGKRYTVTGFLSYGNENELRFTPYRYCKNHSVFEG